MKKMLMLGLATLIIFALFADCCFGMGERARKRNIESIDEELMLNTESIIKTLLGANKVFIHSPKVRGDIDNDGREELVVFAVVVGEKRPDNAGGKLEYLKKKHKASDDLMILFKGAENEYKFKSYYIDAFGGTNDPNINLKDINSDGKPEIFLSNGSDFTIYVFDKGKLRPALFKGGGVLNDLIIGPVKFWQPESKSLVINYGPKNLITDVYVWSGAGHFELSSTNACKPAEIQQQVIDRFESQINKTIMFKSPNVAQWHTFQYEFYSGNKFFVHLGAGDVGGTFLGRYQFLNNEISIECISDPSSPLMNELMKKHGIIREKAKVFIKTRNGFVGPPLDI